MFILLYNLACFNSYFDDIVDIFVGYNSTLYTTSEGIGQVQVCAVLMAPGSAIALQDFILSSTTENGTASTSYNIPSIAVKMKWSVMIL